MDARRRTFFRWSGFRASKFDGLLKLAKSPGFRKTLATVAGSAGYVALGQAGYQPGVTTSAGLDAEQVRMLIAAGFAIGSYIIPAGALSVVKNWANILGKQSADRITALEARVSALEKPAKEPAK